MLNFKDSVLLMSPRSPFARRVRLAMREAGVPYQERAVEVLKPSPELTRLNPLARVPTLELKSGEVLYDSNLILSLFHESHPSALMPKEPKARLGNLCWGTLATGVCEKVVEYFFDTQRPTQDSELTQEVADISSRVLTRLEGAIGAHATILPFGLTQADLDLGTMLRYLVLRYSSDWRTKYPGCSRYLEGLEERASFQATMPPAPV